MDTFRSLPSDVIDPKNIFDTTKMFFGKYLCRIEFNLAAARLLYDIEDMTFDALTSFLNNRTSVFKTDSGNVYCRRESDTSVADAAKLYSITEIVKRYKNKIKLIIRGANVRLYLETIDELIAFIDHTRDFLSGEFLSAFVPKNEEAEALLKSNVIFVPHPKYQYKVTVREGKYNIESKQRLAQYLGTADPTNVHITPHFSELLANEKPYVYGSFFVNDLGITLFATLIDPTFINKIYKLEDPHNK